MWPAEDLAALAHDGTTVNLAHGGMTSSQLRLALLTEPAVRSKWAIVQIGINDLHPLAALPSREQRARSNLDDNLRESVGLLLARSEHVIVTTIIAPDRVPLTRRFSWDPRTLQRIESANATILGLRGQASVFVLDTNQLLRNPDGYLQSRYADNDFFLHINAAGYRSLSEAVGKLMSQTPAS